jgi:hypothetical protein
MKKILLDENLSKQLQEAFSTRVAVYSVRQLGWQLKQNGELLGAMQDNVFQYLITVDRNLQYQQNLEKYGIVVVVIFTYNNRLKTLLPQIPMIEEAIHTSEPNKNILIVDIRASMP